jgi:outer membrane beta-barrel protein
MGKFLRVLGLSPLFVAAAVSAQVEEGQGAVDQYRVQSHYGPEEALLSPLFPRDQKLEISGGAAWAPLSSLVDSWAYTGSLVYHINRRHAVEPVYYSKNTSKLGSFVTEELAPKIDDAKRTDSVIAVPQQIVAASYLFSPYHAKLHLSERSVSHFDLYFGLGAGALQNLGINLNQVEGKKSWNAGVLATGGIRMLFEPRFALRLEARDFIHSADNFGAKGTTHHFQMGAALSIFFGSFSSL